ncbi:MAG: BON domain-containing protein [Chitinivibrionales bacterium]|nr:BON domain-containing protein [Chitinivibrionales bacterium]
MSVSEEIKKNVFDALYWDDTVDASKVQVEASDGKVKLTGSVPTYQARKAAYADAFSVAGVHVVDNNIDVKPLSPPEVPSDEEIKSRIKDFLQWNGTVDPAEIEITVDNGWVTLRGSVTAYWKKMQAEDLAADVRGVIGITNELAVVPTGNHLDKAISDNIVSALERNPSLDAEFIDVRVENGVVILSGTVPIWADKIAAQQIANHTAGVRDVVNHIAVK